MIRFKTIILFILAVVCLILSGMSVVKQKATPIKKINDVMLTNITDQADTAYTNVTFTDSDGNKYHLVIHDIYVEKEKIFEGYQYSVEYREHQVLRPNNFVESID